MATAKPLSNVLICEDHYVSAVGAEILLRKLLPEPIRVRIATTGTNAVALAAQETPDLALIDLAMPDLPGLEVIKALRAQCPATRLVVLTAMDDAALIRQVYQLRVDAILRKTQTDQNLREAIQHLGVRRGKTFLDPPMQKVLQRSEGRSLTPKEYEVVNLMAEGLTSQEIAKRMKCSISTVKTYRARIMNKSGARNSAEIMAWHLKGNAKASFGSGA